MKDGLPFSISFGGFFKTEFDMYYNSLSLRRHYPDQVHGYNLSPLYYPAFSRQVEVSGNPSLLRHPFRIFHGKATDYFQDLQ